MAKHSKKEKSELDAILDQLKNTYKADSSNSVANDITDSQYDSDVDYMFDNEEDEEDAELNEILNNLFASDSKEEESATDTDISIDEKLLVSESIDEDTEDLSVEASIDNDSNNGDTAVAEQPVSEEDTCESSDNLQEISNEPSIINNLEEPVVDTEACEQVDNVLSTMLGGISLPSSNEDISEDELSDTIAEAQTDFTDEHNAVNNVNIDLSEETDIVSDIDFDGLSGFDVSFDSDDSDMVNYEFSLSDESDTDISENENFAVEDEEYDISDSEFDISADQSSDEIDISPACSTDISADEDLEYAESTASESQYDITYSKPKLILSPDEYTLDPLQNLFPTFTLKDHNEENGVEISNNGFDLSKISEESFDNNDISLLLKFGYDNEIKSKVGSKKTQEIIIEQDNEFIPDKFHKPFGYCGSEFSNREQIPQIKEKYKSNLLSSIILLSIVSLLAVLIFAVDIFFAFFSSPVEFFPVAVFFEFLFILTICATIFNKVFSGLIGIARFEPQRSTPFVFLTVFYLIYLVISLIIYLTTPTEFEDYELMLFGYCLALYAISLLVTDILDCIRESHTFSIMASSGVLSVAEKDNSTVTGAGIKSSSNNNNTYKLTKAGLVSGYFKKVSSKNYNRTDLIYLIGIVPIISLICGGAVAICTESIMLGLAMLILTVFLSTPLSCMFAQPIIDFVISKWLRKNKTAFINFDSLEDISKADTLVFSDSDAIEIKSCLEIKPLKDHEDDEYSKIAYTVFSMLGGPLNSICPEEYISDNNKTQRLIINDIQENGIDLYYDNSINLLIGDKYFMYTHKINVKTDTNLNAATKGANKSVIYVAFDGTPKLGFIINSKIKSSFANISKTLKNASINVSVETYEPEANKVYFEQNKIDEMPQVNVIKPISYEPVDENKVCNTSIVSVSDSISIAQSIVLSREFIHQKKILKVINKLVAALGIFISALLSALCCMTFIQFDFSFVLNNIPIIFFIVFIIGILPCAIKLLILILEHKTKTNKTETNK